MQVVRMARGKHTHAEDAGWPGMTLCGKASKFLLDDDEPTCNVCRNIEGLPYMLAGVQVWGATKGGD